MDFKEKILNAFKELVEIKGFYSVTMDELAGKARVSKRTIYRYFSSKEELIEAAIEWFKAEAAVEFERMLQSDLEAHEIMFHMLNFLIGRGRFLTNSHSMDDLQHHYPHLWKGIDEYRASRIKILAEKVMKDNRQGVIQEIDPRITTQVILTSISAVLNPEFILSNGLTFEDAVRQLSTLLVTIIEQ
jgi:AcrR family transcriptional regulator